MILLELKELKKIYNKGGDAPFTAVSGINLNVMNGDFISVIGKSGSGKTTMLNMTAGLLRPTSGEIFINRVNLWSMNDKNMAAIRNSLIGYIPQGLSLLSNLTILDNVRLPFFLAKRKGSGIERAMNLLEEMRIQKHAKKYPSQLSGGEMRRAMIARALMNYPQILIADEPTVDLDEETAKEVIEVFAEINRKGLTILMVTHENDMTGYGNRLCVMSCGKLIENEIS